MNKFSITVLSCSFLTAYFIINECAFAQETSNGSLEVIEVTAQKRIQSIQTVPIAITAISSDSLSTNQINHAREITALVPNLNATRSVSGISNYFIRGVGMDGFNLSSVAAVGLYLDDIAIINPMLANFALYDISRIEVLKGPQNTLYGKNTTGGAINFISKIPNEDDEISGYSQLTLGNYNQYNFEGAIGSKINELLSTRLSGFIHKRDGLVNSEVEGNNSQFNNIDQYGLRFQLAYQYSEKIKLSASFYGGQQDQIAEVKTALSPQAGSYIIDVEDNDLSKNHTQLINPPNDIQSLGGFLKLNFTGSAVIFNSISSFEKVTSTRMDDWGSQQLPSAVFQSVIYNSTDTQYLSQEFQWQSFNEANYHWIVGVQYSQDKGDILQAALIDPGGPGRPDDAIPDAGIGPMFDRGAWVEQDSKTQSIYGQIAYQYSNDFTVTSGLRWTNQELTPTVNAVGMMMDLPDQEFPLGSLGWYSLGNNDFNRNEDFFGFARAQQFLNANGGFPASEKIDKHFNEWGGKLAFDYRVNKNLMLYSLYSRGFKMGAVNSNPTTAAFSSLLQNVVVPERLITTEIGFKSDLFDNSIRFNGAIFNNVWKNYQFFLVSNPGNPADLIASLVNLPEAKSKGAELELTWQTSSSLVLNLGVGWLNSKVSNGELDTTGVPESNINNFQNQVQRGNQLTNAPKWNFNLSMTKQFELDESDLQMSIYYKFLGKHTHQLAGNNSQNWLENFSEESVGLLTINSQFSFGQQREYQLSLWVKNLVGERYCSERSVVPGASPETIRLCSQGDPRTFGVTVRMDF